MDNFKRHKQKLPQRPVDGFVTGNHHRYQRTGSVGTFRARTDSAPSVKVGDFKRTDGFHPAQQPTLAVDGKPSENEGIIIDDEADTNKGEAQKKNRFSLKSVLHRKESRKSRKSHKKGYKKKIRRALAIGTCLILLVGGILFSKAYLNLQRILPGGGGAAALNEEVDLTKLNGEGDGRINILLLGKGGDGHTAPDLTDTILIASIDPIAHEAALLSIPRDFYVKVDNYGSMKINAAYATGKNSVLNGKKIPDQAAEAEKKGMAVIQKTVETTMGVPIHYNVMVDFEGFSKAIDTVGGVDINVTNDSAVYEVMSLDGKKYILDVKPGKQTFDGKRALAFSRSRYTSARGDFSRAERQRLMITALKEKILSAGTYSNPLKVSQLIDNFGDHVHTNFTLDEVMRLYDISKGISSDKIASIGLADPPNNYITTSNINGLSVVIPRAGVDNYKEIQSYVRNSLKDAFIKSENASILILNGTSRTGLATKRSDELKSFGYNIAGIGDAPTKDYQKTTLIDLRNGDKKYTKTYLEKRLGVTAATSLPDPAIVPGTADFVIILGANESNSTN